MSIHADSRQYGSDEEYAEWKRDLKYEYRGESVSRKMPKPFIAVPAVYGDVPSPDIPECDGDFREDYCIGCSEYDECRKINDDN